VESGGHTVCAAYCRQSGMLAVSDASFGICGGPALSECVVSWVPR
jgi:hypothetical protein